MVETDTLLRELNHRVNNNFQIVVSLMNLKKRLLPPERQDDIRFIEEHVQSMAVAYRLIYARGDLLEVAVDDLMTDVVLGLRLIAKLPAERVAMNVRLGGRMVTLDQAIALGLYLAVVLPPYLDHARSTNGTINISAGLDTDHLIVAVSGDWGRPVTLDVLRERLMVAYIAQLGAEHEQSDSEPLHKIGFFVASPQVVPLS